MKHARLILAFALLAFSIAASAAEAAPARPTEFPPKPPVQPLSPDEERKTFQLPPGYRLELVLSEPEIKEPVVCAFDGNGRMFVAEMRTYMQDAEGTAQLVPSSRVSMHADTNGDGKFDRHTVFADKLLLPRMVLPLDEGRVVINETDSFDLFLHTDTNGDGAADKKELWWKGGPRGGNLEHQPSGLIWAIDNWLYTTYNNFRLRWTPNGVLKAPAASNGGQWGMAQDNYGKLFFINGGGERGPMSFQVPIAYADLNPKGQVAPGFEEVWPAVGVADFQGGLGRVRQPDKTLNHFTATAGAEVYRGDRLPAELHGNLFFGEPVGRLVRRATIENRDGLTVLTNPHQAQKTEFLRSTDLCFRPLNMVNAPDGTLYLVDMYRGIIQEGNWTRPGSYLRKVVDEYRFDKVIGRGRIWRLVHDSAKPGPLPKMNRETTAELVAHFNHPNGWWRDTAQKLLILKRDKGVVPALTQLVRTSGNHLARLHALWTLEGLDAFTPGIARERLKDEHPQLRIAALRAAESLVRKGDLSLQREMQALAKDKDPNVALQAALTARLLNWPEHQKQMEELAAASPAAGVREIAGIILTPPTQNAVALSPQEQKVMKAGAEIYKTLCVTCHGPDGKGMPMVGAAPGAMLGPPLAGSKTVTGPREGGVLVLLHGLTGEIDGKKYEGLMIPMANNDDVWIASALSYVRNSFGNRASFITPPDVARVRHATKDRAQPWTIAELRATLPKALGNRKQWKVSASHNPASAGAAFDGNLATRFDTSTSQVPGMWFQVELPEATEITGLQLDAGKSTGDYPRGYKVELSSDGGAWKKAIAEGKGMGPVTEIVFPPAKTKFIRITQTGSVNGLFWSIHELDIYAAKTTAKSLP